jgi:hypothetical protein
MAKLRSVPDIKDTSVESDPPEDQHGDGPKPAKKAAKKTTAATKKAAAPAAPPKSDEFDPSETDLLGSAVSLEDATDYLSVLWYGKQGTGKTSHLASMVNVCEGLVYIVNAEAGLKRKPLERLGIDTSRIRVLPDLATGQRLTFEFLEGLFWQAKDALEKNPGSIGGFGFDSVTEIHQVLLNNIVAEEVAKAERVGKDRDRFFKTQDNYGVMAAQFTEILRKFRDLPCHFAATALERRDVDQQTGKVVYRPAVTPALQTPMGGIPDLIGHTTVEEIEGVDQYIGMFRPSGVYDGKDRYGILPRHLVDPTFARVHGYAAEDLSIDEDPVMQEAIAHRRAASGKRRLKGGGADDGTGAFGEDDDETDDADQDGDD